MLTCCRLKRKTMIRVCEGKRSFNKQNVLFTGGLRLDLTKQLGKIMVGSVMMYISENTEVGRSGQKHSRCGPNRKLQKIKWTVKVTKWGCSSTGQRIEKVDGYAKGRKKRWVGQLHHHNCLLKNAMDGRMKGKRPNGRKRYEMMDDGWGKTLLHEIKRKVKNQEIIEGNVINACFLKITRWATEDFFLGLNSLNYRWPFYLGLNSSACSTTCTRARPSMTSTVCM